METSDSGELPDDGNQSAASTERRRKRDSRNCIDPPSLDPENETSGFSKLRKTHTPLTYSDPPLANMDPPLTHSDYTTGDKSESDSSSSDEREVSDPVSTWEYKDLLDLNIRYPEKPEPIENFIQEIKDTFRNRKGFCLDC
ncbi:uncharacterized protein LOC134257019, partial [Saccostrea cucullata]|uniref:uncharacterized protein LOC134257019 n=1 Tax=Saccostrea cuccullata TaxID=36930 RepID=UPI002ED03E36